MKFRYFLFWAIIILALGYIVGQFVPMEYFKPNIISKEINLNDFYTRLITIGGIMATLIATIVALFKEDLRKLWEYAALEIELKDPQNILSEILDTESSESDDDNDSNNSLRAKRYELQIIVKNKGRLPAKNCEIYLESLQFKNTSYTSYQEITVTGIALDWLGKNQKSILIHPSGKSHITVVELFSQESITDNLGNDSRKECFRIKFGNIESPAKYKTGKWIAIFSIYTENTKPTKYKIELEWNGKWEQRLTEMTSKNIKISNTQII